jgi:hypothetical protein
VVPSAVKTRKEFHGENRADRRLGIAGAESRLGPLTTVR